jgi:hypothetical protein
LNSGTAQTAAPASGSEPAPVRDHGPMPAARIAEIMDAANLGLIAAPGGAVLEPRDIQAYGFHPVLNQTRPRQCRIRIIEPQ